MSKNKNVDATASVSPEVSEVVNVSIEGLETSVNPTELETSSNPDLSNRDYLEKNDPDFSPEFASSKYDAEREPKVQEGLLVIQELLGDKINPLIILLGKYWEIKPARAAIKKMIDAEAASLNIPADHYMQKTLRENIDKLASISQAIDRLKYAITYFKPRPGKETKDVFQTMSIDGTMYSVSLNELAKAKETFGTDKVAIKAHLASISKEVIIDELL